MKSHSLGDTDLIVSRMAYGCWRIADPTPAGEDKGPSGRRAVLAAYDAGYTFFDLADIYGDGECERLFGRVLRNMAGMRDHIVVATKCGIRKPGSPSRLAPYRYDFSAEHILKSCDASLDRMGIETIDLYMLHRPDYLMDPAEVASAFAQLKSAGKVREFGVSNFRPSQIAALQKACPMRLLVNQVEISLANLLCLQDGTLDHCLAEGIIPMAWSPLAGGKLGQGARRLLPSQEAYQTDTINALLSDLAKAYGTNQTAIALAWLLRHPSRIIPVVGSTDPTRIRETAAADGVTLSREDWYRLLTVARNERLP